MEIICWIVTVLIIGVTFMVAFNRRKALNLPGPIRLPLVGNLHQLNTTKLHVLMLEWTRRYGPVYQVWFGPKPVVIVTGSKQVHEVLVEKGKDFNAKLNSFILRKLACGGNNISFSDAGEEWKVQKKMLHTALNVYGHGFDKINQLTCISVNKWIDGIHESYDASEGLDIRRSVEDVTFDIINAVVLDESMHTGENASQLRSCVDEMTSLLHRFLQFEGFLLDTVPMLRFMLTSIPRDIDQFLGRLRALYSNLKQDELDSMANGDTTGRDTTSKPALFSKLIRYQLENNKVQLDDDRIMLTVMDSYFGGIATTSVSLAFLFQILAQKRDIQTTIQEEIDRVVRDGPIELKHRDQMPYTHATLLEMLRFTSIGPLLFHRTARHTSIDGFHVPEDTEVWINAWGLHHDESVWDQPFQFLPQRFLDSTGGVVLADHPHRKNLVAFGTGPRVCPAEAFAMFRMLLLLTTFLQKFSVSSDDDHPPYDTRDLDLGLMLEPPAYKLKLQARD